MTDPKFVLPDLLLQCDMKARGKGAEQPWGTIIGLSEIELMHG